MCEIDIGNLKTRNFTKLVQVRNFIHLFEFKGFSTWGERQQSFSADCIYIFNSQPNQRAAPVAHQVVWPRPALKVNLLLRKQELNYAFSQISALASGAWRHPNTLVPIPIWDFLFWHLWMTNPLRAPVNTCINAAPN